MKKFYFFPSILILFFSSVSLSQNVGIGTNTPSYKLDVRTGSINTDSVYRIGGNTVLSVKGFGNTMLGTGSGNANTTGTSNTGTGYRALYTNTTGSYNTATGFFALYGNTTGNENTANGYEALYLNTTGFFNVANGYEALYSNTTGAGNIANGNEALYFNTSGDGNVANGHHALHANTTGDENTASGNFVLQLNSTGRYNTANGSNALGFNASGNYNTALGGVALYVTANSSYNTAVGYAAGDGFNNGSLNVFVGEESDATVAGLSNVIAVGQGTMVGASNLARFGNSGTTSYGGFAGWSNFSDGRFKKNIKENVPGLAFITKLRPVTYTLDASGLDAFLHKNNISELSAEAKSVYEKALTEKEKIINTGFIAQEVEAAAIQLGFNFSGVDAPKNENDTYGLRYAEFVVPLVKAVQEQQQMIEALKKKNQELLDMISNQKRLNEDLQSRVEKLESIVLKK